MGKLSEQQIQAFIDAEKTLKAAEKDILKIYQSSLKNVRAEIMALNEKIEWTQWDIQKYNRLDKLQLEIFSEVKNISNNVYKILSKTNKNIVNDSYKRGWYGYEKESGVELRFGKITPETIQGIVEDPYPNVTLKDLIQDRYKRHVAKLKMTIGNGLIQGKSAQEMSRMIKDDLNISYQDSLRIIRTEGLRAESKSMLELTNEAEEMGIKVKKIWNSTLDMKTRPSHANMDGQEANKDGLFVLNSGKNQGAKAEAPRMFGIAEEDIQCRCTYIEEIEDLPSNIEQRRDAITGELIDNMTYNEWLEWKKK